MKKMSDIFRLSRVLGIGGLVFCVLFFGCEQEQRGEGFETSSEILGSKPWDSIYAQYHPVKVHIVGLTKFSEIDPAASKSVLLSYAELVDEFGSRIKSPGIFRFELYDYVPRSSREKGSRVFAWPDIDLNSPAKNSSFFRDYLRSYEFKLNLDFAVQSGKIYILEATFITPAGKRYSDSMEVKG